ncbi:MAG: amidase family protein [Negativicutes bacterium]
MKAPQRGRWANETRNYAQKSWQWTKIEDSIGLRRKYQLLFSGSLGTDSGGSIRVPASLCGVWGMRPSLHRISEAGVLPFMPSVSTVGAVAADFDILDRAMRVLLRSGTERVAKLQRIVVLEDAFKLADKPVREASESVIARMAKRVGIALERVLF